MTCTRPIKAWIQTEARLDIPAKDYYALKKVSFRPIKGRIEIEIPCGHCLGCRLDHANMWATRCEMERKNWQHNCFVTLTYNNDNLPVNKNNLATLKKKDLQDFFKRLRYHESGKEEWTLTDEKNPIRYFACGEYGPKGGRPHYHAIIFNWVPDDLKFYKFNKYGDPIYTSKKLQGIWGKGFVTVEFACEHNIQYCCQYVNKKAGIAPQSREYTGEIKREWRIDERNGEPYEHFIRVQKRPKELREPEFITMSRAVGIGKKYYEENKEKIIRNKGILIKSGDKVKLRPIPKYFKKLWETEDWIEYYRFKYEKSKDGIKRKAEIISKISMPDGTDDEYKWEFYLKNTEESLKQKVAKNLSRNMFV